MHAWRTRIINFSRGRLLFKTDNSDTFNSWNFSTRWIQFTDKIRSYVFRPQRDGVLYVHFSRTCHVSRKKTSLDRVSNRRDSHFWDDCQDFCWRAGKMTGKGIFPFIFSTRLRWFLSLSLDLGNSSSDNFFLRNWSAPAAFSFDRVLRTIATINDAYRLIWIKLISSNRNRLTFSFVCILITMKNSKTRGGTFEEASIGNFPRLCLSLNGSREPFSSN